MVDFPYQLVFSQDFWLPSRPYFSEGGTFFFFSRGPSWLAFMIFTSRYGMPVGHNLDHLFSLELIGTCQVFFWGTIWAIFRYRVWLVQSEYKRIWSIPFDVSNTWFFSSRQRHERWIYMNLWIWRNDPNISRFNTQQIFCLSVSCWPVCTCFHCSIPYVSFDSEFRAHTKISSRKKKNR